MPILGCSFNILFIDTVCVQFVMLDFWNKMIQILFYLSSDFVSLGLQSGDRSLLDFFSYINLNYIHMINNSFLIIQYQIQQKLNKSQSNTHPSISMIYKNKSRSLNYKQRHFIQNSGTLPKQQSRLVFPIKQSNENYVGKKQYFRKYEDQILLGNDLGHYMLRKNKLDVTDIDGATPSLNIQSVKNKSKVLHSQKYGSMEYLGNKDDHKRRVVTDSLDILVNQNKSLSRPDSKRRQKSQSNQILKNGQYLKKSASTRHGLENYLVARNNQLTKQHILGLYSQNSKLHNPQLLQKQANKAKLPLNPTYLSSIKLY